MNKNEWTNFLNNELKYLSKTWLEGFDTNKFINDFAKKELTVNSPQKEDIFNAFKIGKNDSIITPAEVEVLILGQDPYPNPVKAHGMAFSHKEGYKDIDKSLKNIYKAIFAYQHNEKFDNVDNSNISAWSPNMKKWASINGVLLLNTALTHESDDTDILKKHRNRWNKFIEQIILKLIDTKKQKKLVVFLWGKPAQTVFFNSLHKMKLLNPDNTPPYVMRKLVFMTSHPSPRGVNDGFSEDAPIHFEACDKFLEKNIWKNFPENKQKI